MTCAKLGSACAGKAAASSSMHRQRKASLVIFAPLAVVPLAVVPLAVVTLAVVRGLCEVGERLWLARGRQNAALRAKQAQMQADVDDADNRRRGKKRINRANSTEQIQQGK